MQKFISALEHCCRVRGSFNSEATGFCSTSEDTGCLSWGAISPRTTHRSQRPCMPPSRGCPAIRRAAITPCWAAPAKCPRFAPQLCSETGRDGDGGGFSGWGQRVLPSPQHGRCPSPALPPPPSSSADPAGLLLPHAVRTPAPAWKILEYMPQTSRARYLNELRAILQVLNYGYIEAVVPCGEGQRAAGHAGAHPGVLGESFAQVASGFWVLRPVTGEGCGRSVRGPAPPRQTHRHAHTHAHSGRRATSTAEERRAGRNVAMNTSYRKGAVLPCPGAEATEGMGLSPLTGLPRAMRCPHQQPPVNPQLLSLGGDAFLPSVGESPPPQSPGLSTITICAAPSTELLRTAL